MAEQPLSAVKPFQSRTLTVHVLDSDNQPIAGARIFQNHCFFPAGSERAKLENHTFTTDVRGIAVLTVKGKNEDLRLWVSKEKFCPLYAMWIREYQSDGDQIPAEFTFRLERGTRVGGIVHDELGKPIAGVKVAVENLTAAIPVPDPPQPGRRPVPSPWLAENDEVTTDSQGRWILENVPADGSLVFDLLLGELSPGIPKIALKLSHQDYVEDRYPGQLQRVQKITLESLRNQSATIVMKTRNPTQKN
ncbi:MAG: hypothetical protein KDA77_08115 [Planctomycetaceae bacterium]|nr:hypothetical protein [Planctomycetaceae bacterium]